MGPPRAGVVGLEVWELLPPPGVDYYRLLWGGAGTPQWAVVVSCGPIRGTRVLDAKPSEPVGSQAFWDTYVAPLWEQCVAVRGQGDGKAPDRL